MKTYAVLRYVTKKGRGSWRPCGDSGEGFGALEETRALFNTLTYLYPNEHYRLVKVKHIEDSKR